METAIVVVVVMGCVGILFGFLLAYANKNFSVEINPLIHKVEDALPKGQCGACGYPGCLAYAQAVVLDKQVAANLCTPGKSEVALLVAKLTGKTAKATEARVAHIKCAGELEKAVRKYRYTGVQDCVAANSLLGGPKTCSFGCLGFGTCLKACKFGAITLRDDGLPLINKKKVYWLW